MRRLLRLAVLSLVAGIGLGVAPASAGGGCHEPTEREATGTTVELVAMCIEPTILHVDRGDTVTFTNRDDLEHNLVGLGWGYGMVRPGESVTQVFDEDGVHPYACTLHPNMVGAVVVGDQTAAPATVPIANTATDRDEAGFALPLGLGAVLGAGAAAAGLLLRRRAART